MHKDFFHTKIREILTLNNIEEKLDRPCYQCYGSGIVRIRIIFPDPGVLGSSPVPYPILQSTTKFTTNAYWFGHGGPTDVENKLR